MDPSLPTEQSSLGWFGIVRVGLAQAALGAVVVLATSTLNRVLVVEYAFPAIVPALLVAVHYGVQLLRPSFGYRSDLGRRRTPWVLGGMAVLGASAIVCAASTLLIHRNLGLALGVALVGYIGVGLGVGSAGTSLLALLASSVDSPRRAGAATVMWCLMIAGFAIASIAAGHFLDPFSPRRLVQVVGTTAAIAWLVSCVTLFGVERAVLASAAPAKGPGIAPKSGNREFERALRQVWSDPSARRFTLFVFISMLAYSAQELLLEPFAGLVFGFTPGLSAQLSGLWHASALMGMLGAGLAGSGSRRMGSLATWTMFGCIASAVSLVVLAGVGVAGSSMSLRASVVALGLGNGVFATSAIASMMERAHESRVAGAGILMGVWGAAQAVAFALGAVFGTLVLDSTRYYFGSPRIAFGLVFLIEAALFCAAVRFMTRTAAGARTARGARIAGGVRSPDSAADPSSLEIFDVVVVGGGPAGSVAATDLARTGHRVCLLDRAGRIKPCGGAVPPKVMEEFEIPESLLVARINAARMVSPSQATVDMPIEGGYVGMVDREVFDEWLRERARHAGVDVRVADFSSIDRDIDGAAIVKCRGASSLRARAIVGADGAMSAVAKQCIPGAHKIRYVAAYHEIVRIPESPIDPESPIGQYSGTRCDVFYQGHVSPDFYGWVFPHGGTASIGVGSANKGFSLRRAVTDLRVLTHLSGAETVRREGAPIPMKPLSRWDNGRDVVLAGDAAGVVAPASGEGIYYAMAGGRFAADAVAKFLETGDARALREARRRFMKAHGMVFWILGMMQRFWYSTDKRRERFVSICADPDVQRLTWQAYMYKKLVRARPLTHMRIFAKDMAHLLGLVRA